MTKTYADQLRESAFWIKERAKSPKRKIESPTYYHDLSDVYERLAWLAQRIALVEESK